MESNRFRVCTICRNDIPFGGLYFRCSVSTCNGGKIPQYFCSLDCFTAHVPTMRHRDAWAEKTRAPMQPSATELIAPDEEEPAKASGIADEKEILVVVSKLKAYVRAKSGMNTSDTALPVLSDVLRRACDAAIRRAAADGRKTVMDRDFDLP